MRDSTLNKVADVLALCSLETKEQAVETRRRMNAHLLLGIVTVIVGMAFAWLTLPDLRHTQGWTLVAVAVPRLACVSVIEVLAGFFLRQYRIGLEDHKDSLCKKRDLDKARIAYLAIIESGIKRALVQYAQHIIASSADEIKQAAKNYAELSKAERNPFLETLEKLGAVAKAIPTSSKGNHFRLKS